MRCFVGFLVPEAAKSGLLALQEQLRKLPVDCKYVESENLHVCLSFLGEIDEAAVAKAEAGLEAVCKEGFKFGLAAGCINLIPSESYVRVIVLDVHDASGSLGRIAEGVKRGVGGDAKPPHITLCRVRDIRDKPATVEKIKKIAFEKIEFDVDEISLIKSELGAGEPKYSVVKGFRLK